MEMLTLVIDADFERRQAETDGVSHHPVFNRHE
jgi:hypothetical protein